MNVTLNNQLVNAVNILREAEREFGSKIDMHNKEIIDINKKINAYQNSTRYIPKPMLPTQMYQKQQISMILLLFFVWPVGIPYAIYFLCTKKKLQKKNNEKYVEEMIEYNRKVNQLNESINEERKRISEIKSSITNIESLRQIFFKKNNESLAFLPKSYRTLKAAKHLYVLVHEEYAFTLRDAINRHEREIQELIELEERIEERERAEALAEKRHRDLQKSLDDLAYHQKRSVEEQSRINENLDKLHQDNLRNR